MRVARQARLRGLGPQPRRFLRNSLSRRRSGRGGAGHVKLTNWPIMLLLAAARFAQRHLEGLVDSRAYVEFASPGLACAPARFIDATNQP